MVSGRCAEKDVLSVSAKIEVVMIFSDCGWQTIPDGWGWDAESRAAVIVSVDGTVTRSEFQERIGLEQTGWCWVGNPRSNTTEYWPYLCKSIWRTWRNSITELVTSTSSITPTRLHRYQQLVRLIWSAGLRVLGLQVGTPFQHVSQYSNLAN